MSDIDLIIILFGTAIMVSLQIQVILFGMILKAVRRVKTDKPESHVKWVSNCKIIVDGTIYLYNGRDWIRKDAI
jgi:hypothetical protein